MKTLLLFLWVVCQSVVAIANETYAYTDENGKIQFSKEKKLGRNYYLVEKEGWESVSTTSQENATSTVWVQTKSIATSGKYVKAWSVSDFSNPQTIANSPNKSYTRSLQLTYFNCAERKLAGAQITYYFEKNFVASSSFDEAKRVFEEVVPETVGEAMLERACLHQQATPPKPGAKDENVQRKPK